MANIVGYSILGFIGIINLSPCFENAMKSKFAVWFLVLFMLSTLGALSDVYDFKRECYCLLISLLALFVGLGVSANPRFIERLLKLYAVILSVIGFVIVKTSLGEMVIADQYMVQSKNAICPMYAIGIVILAVYVCENKRNLMNIVYLGVMALLFADIMYARGRAAMLSSLLIVGFIFLKSIGKINVTTIFICMFAMLLLPFFIYLTADYLQGLYSIIFSSFTQNRDIYDINSLSAGRVETYKYALRVISENPLFGGADYRFTSLGGRVHNYPLHIASSLGLLGGFPYIAVWCMLVYTTAKKMWKDRLPMSTNIGWFMMAVLLIVSLFEPSMPHTPGSVCAIAFFFVGIAINTSNRVMRGW